MFKPTVALLSLASLLASVPGPALAGGQAPIVVEGRSKQFLRSFISSLAQSGPTGQLARWSQEVCPSVEGIDPAEAVFVENRIVEVASGLGLRRGGSGCVTTLMVVVTADPAALADSLVQHYPIRLRRDGGFARLRRFARTTAPVRWISVINECGQGCSLPGSRLVKDTTPTFDAMIIIVDANRIATLTIGELSDYVALVSLSNPPLGARASSRSVLSLFDTSRADGPRALTAYDLSFLDGLYRSSINQSDKVQRQSILSHMEKDGLGRQQ